VLAAPANYQISHYIRGEFPRPDEFNWKMNSIISNNSNTTTANASPTDTQGTTTMITDRPVVVGEQNKAITVPSLKDYTTTSFDPSLREFLGNWITVTSGTIDSTITAGTQVTGFTVLSTWLASTPIAQKLVGYQGIRGTFRVRLQINANQFQQGRLQLSWGPFFDRAGFLGVDRLSTLCTLSQLPRVNINLNSMSGAEMCIPFVCPSTFHDLCGNSLNTTWGNVYLHVISPLAYGTGGSTNFGYTILLSMDPDSIELFNPTYNTAPTMGGIRPMSGTGMPRTKGKANVSESEAKKEGKLSSYLGTASKFAGTVGKFNPDLALFTGVAEHPRRRCSLRRLHGLL